MRHVRTLAGFAVFVAAWFAACASSGRSAAVKLDAESGAHVDAGRFQEAVDVCREAWKAHPGDKDVAAGFSRTLDRILAAGDAAMKKGDFAAAERIYAVLLKNHPGDKALAPPPSCTRAGLESRIRSARIALAAARAERSRKAGDFPKAVEGLADILKAYPRDPGAIAKAAAGLESIRGDADAARTGMFFSKAGVAYYSLWKNYPRFGEAHPKLSFDRKALDTLLSGCRTALTRQGLELYRKGDLKAAIAVWKSLLLFDPDNAPIRKSIETATAQLDRIQSSGM